MVNPVPAKQVGATMVVELMSAAVATVQLLAPAWTTNSRV
jgi:hypothetical protein